MRFIAHILISPKETMTSVAIPLLDLDPTKFKFSSKKTKSWDFVDKAKKKCSGSKQWVELYYENEGQKLCFALDDMKSFSGIQQGKDFKRGFMSLSMKKEISEMVRKQLDVPIFNLAFMHRKDLLKNGAKIKEPAEMRIIFNGVVTDGQEKKDEPGKNWDDNITATIPMKKKGQQVIVDDDICVIEDVQGKPYSWTALDKKPLKEVAVEIDKISFSDKIKVEMTFRLIVPDALAVPKITTKRRLEHRDMPTTADATADPATAAATTSSTAPATQEPDKQAPEEKNKRIKV